MKKILLAEDNPFDLELALAGLAWGTYVPIIFYGGNELSAKQGPSGRFMAILCVGGAYFVIGVLLPVLMFSIWAESQSSLFVSLMRRDCEYAFVLACPSAHTNVTVLVME